MAQIERLSPASLAAMAALQGAALFCLWALQLLSLHEARWRPVIASQLAGNALAKIAPGGGAMGAALQYRMLVEAGLPAAGVVSGLTAANLLTFAVVLALPVLAIPAILRGGVDRDLRRDAALVGPRRLRAAVRRRRRCCSPPSGRCAGSGASIQRVAQPAAPRRGAAAARCPERLLRERDRILAHARPALEARAGRGARPLGVRLRLTCSRRCARSARTRGPASSCWPSAPRRCSRRSRSRPAGSGFVEAG